MPFYIFFKFDKKLLVSTGQVNCRQADRIIVAQFLHTRELLLLESNSFTFFLKWRGLFMSSPFASTAKVIFPGSMLAMGRGSML